MPSRGAVPFTLRIAVTNAWVSQLFDLELSKRGVEPFQSGTLLMIRRLEPVTPSGLHAEMGVPFTTLRNRVNELVRDGLVEKTPNPEDGRSHLLRTTKRAAEVLKASQAAERAVMRRLEKAGFQATPELNESLDELRSVVQELINGALSDRASSLTTGPW